jgi:archaemetzincin
MTLRCDKVKKALWAAGLSLIITTASFFIFLLRGQALEAREEKIILIPVGDVEGSILDALAKDLEIKFGGEVERHRGIEVPPEAYNSARGQYSSSLILKKLRLSVPLGPDDRALGIADVDLYTEGLNFVFGEAEMRGRWAVISLVRLHQNFYSLPENQAIFRERANKEAVHELGHVFGLAHCPDPECVMHFSNSLMDTDKKSASFCPRCRQLLEGSM